ncbi:MAG: hypothetical protein J0H66_01520 [Solirubrobacterales bacterium]|nr:hypothetical protein [Solirubrobacterales bacterium]OJU95457.1 MAG: hypothetical protein BGO23_06360 [Solirubrobacterales bacterium 67-14]
MARRASGFDRAGQATVEAVAGIAALMLAALLCFQLLAAGYSATIADGAAEAGAVALIRGEPVEPAVREALPGWARSRVSVSRIGTTVRVRLRPPALFSSMADKLAVSAEAGGKPG